MARRDTTGLTRYEPSCEQAASMVIRGKGDYVRFDEVEDMIAHLDEHISKLHAHIDRLNKFNETTVKLFGDISK